MSTVNISAHTPAFPPVDVDLKETWARSYGIYETPVDLSQTTVLGIPKPKPYASPVKSDRDVRGWPDPNNA